MFSSSEEYLESGFYSSTCRCASVFLQEEQDVGKLFLEVLRRSATTDFSCSLVSFFARYFTAVNPEHFLFVAVPVCPPEILPVVEGGTNKNKGRLCL